MSFRSLFIYLCRILIKLISHIFHVMKRGGNRMFRQALESRKVE